MRRNNCLLDANAILRFLLQDNEEQFQYVKRVIRNENCYATLEVLAEVCYVLEGLYQVSRDDIINNFRKLNNDITIDFVDCLLYGYRKERGLDIITFDRKLQKRLEDVL